MSEPRTPTPPAWVTRSTYRDRWAQPNPQTHQADNQKTVRVVGGFTVFPLICPQTRDWNEELQTTRELPRKNLPERLLRERAIFKVLPRGQRVTASASGKILAVSVGASQGLTLKDIRSAVLNRTCVDANSEDLLTFFLSHRFTATLLQLPLGAPWQS